MSFEIENRDFNLRDSDNIFRVANFSNKASFDYLDVLKGSPLI